MDDYDKRNPLPSPPPYRPTAPSSSSYPILAAKEKKALEAEAKHITRRGHYCMTLPIFAEAEDLYDVGGLFHLFFCSYLPTLPLDPTRINTFYDPVIWEYNFEDAWYFEKVATMPLIWLTLYGIVPIHATKGYRSKIELRRGMLRFFISTRNPVYEPLKSMLDTCELLLYAIHDSNIPPNPIHPLNLPPTWPRNRGNRNYTKPVLGPFPTHCAPGPDVLYQHHEGSPLILPACIKKNPDASWTIMENALVPPEPQCNANWTNWGRRYCPKVNAEDIVLVEIIHKSYNGSVLPLVLDMLKSIP